MQSLHSIIWEKDKKLLETLLVKALLKGPLHFFIPLVVTIEPGCLTVSMGKGQARDFFRTPRVGSRDRAGATSKRTNLFAI